MEKKNIIADEHDRDHDSYFVIENTEEILEKMEKKSITDDEHDHDHDHDEISWCIEVNPNWDNLQILAEVAEVERIKLEKERKERNLRQYLSTFLKLLDENETEESIKNDSTGAVKLQLSADKVDVTFTKGKRSLRKKISPTAALLSFKKSSSIPHFGFEGKHQEDDANHILFSYGNIIKEPFLLKRSRCCNEENRSDPEDEMPRPKKARKKTKYLGGPSTLPIGAIPEKFKDRILELGGSETSLVFVFQKVLTETDVNPQSSRLLVPFKQIKNGFLTDDERACFEDPNQKFGIDAIFVDPSLDQCRMNLRQWEMGKKDGKVSYNYSLLTHWSKVVRKNQLREGMTVHLWAFRKDSELGFALILVN